jgi:hypothetical protein
MTMTTLLPQNPTYDAEVAASLGCPIWGTEQEVTPAGALVRKSFYRAPQPRVARTSPAPAPGKGRLARSLTISATALTDQWLDEGGEPHRLDGPAQTHLCVLPGTGEVSDISLYHFHGQPLTRLRHAARSGVPVSKLAGAERELAAAFAEQRSRVVRAHRVSVREATSLALDPEMGASIASLGSLAPAGGWCALPGDIAGEPTCSPFEPVGLSGTEAHARRTRRRRPLLPAGSLVRLARPQRMAVAS